MVESSQPLMKSEDRRQPSSYVNISASIIAAILELALFHPLDSIVKRLMSDTSTKARQGMLSSQERLANLRLIIFKTPAGTPLTTSLLKLYNGGFYAAIYKVLQRGLKFGGQPIVRERMRQMGLNDKISPVFGSQTRLIVESLAGTFVGLLEIILLPFDRLKILAQTNPQAVRGRSILNMLMRERMGLYAGAAATATRNAPGSFCLFGGATFTKQVIFGETDPRLTPTWQNGIASLVGSCLSVSVTNPMDVIKTRVQNKSFGQKYTGRQALVDLLRDEGPGALFKGLTPKVIGSAPKLVWAYTVTQLLVQKLDGFSQKK